MFFKGMINIGYEKRTYSFRLDEEVIRQLQLVAQQENRTLSNMVETILKQYVQQRQEQPLA